MAYIVRTSRLALATLTWLIATGTPAASQEVTWDSGLHELSRVELVSLLERFEQAAASGAYSGELRAQAERESSLIRDRLENGDFQVGDQIALSVEGEEALTETFLVQKGPALVLPVIGEISLRGVLRSELVSHLEAEIGRFIRDPVVQARASVRLLISGGVGSAGFFVIPTNTVFSDLLMIAGGPSPTALLQQIRVERSDREIWSGEGLQQAIIEGRTLDQLSIRAGDHVVVPQRGDSGGVVNALRVAAMTVSPIVMIAGILFQIF